MLGVSQTRRNARKFKPNMVPRDMIEQIVTAGDYAANRMDRQSTVIVSATNRDLRNHLSEMNRAIGGWKPEFDPFYDVPVVLIL